MSIISDIVDELTIELKTADFGPTLVVAKAYRPILERKDLGESIRVSVMPASTDYTRHDRSQVGRPTVVDVALQRVCKVADTDTIEESLDIVEEIATHMLGTRTLDDRAICTQVTNEPIYDPEHLDTLHIFTSVLQTRWEVLP